MRLEQVVGRSVQRFRITTDLRHTQATASLMQRRFDNVVFYNRQRFAGPRMPRSICGPAA